MLAIVITMVVILLIAGCVVVYAAYPHRGEDIPHAPWLSDAMTRSNEKVTEKLTALDDSLAAKIDERRDS